MRPLYPNAEDLKNKIEEYFLKTDTPSILQMRIFLGLSKQMINKYKLESGEHWEYLEIAQTTILAMVEHKLMYDDKLSSPQVISHLFILKSYDREQFGDYQKLEENPVEQQAPIFKLDMPKYVKGVQPNAKKAISAVHAGKQRVGKK